MRVYRSRPVSTEAVIRNRIVIRARRPFTLPRKRAAREVRIYDVQGSSEENQWVSVNGFQHAHARLSIKAYVHGSCEIIRESPEFKVEFKEENGYTVKIVPLLSTEACMIRGGLGGRKSLTDCG